jgi:hypothetical protein
MINQRKDPRNTIMPNGSTVGNLPQQVAPATLTMTTLGCPRFHAAQVYFVDFNTGTSMDNLYILTNVTDTISVGKFETSLQFGYQDAYAKFYNVSDYARALNEEQKWLTDPTKQTVKPNTKK